MCVLLCYRATFDTSLCVCFNLPCSGSGIDQDSVSVLSESAAEKKRARDPYNNTFSLYVPCQFLD